MASSVLRLFRRLFLWALWLGLLAVLGVQLRVLSQGGVRVPDSVVDALLGRVAETGFSAGVSEVWIDPRGRILLVAPRVSLATASSAMGEARSAVLQVRRRELLRGQLVFSRAELHGLQLRLPASFSPSGAEETLLQDGEFVLDRDFGETAWTVRQASARVLAIPTSFSGRLPAASLATAVPVAVPAAQRVRVILRRTADIYRRLADLPLDAVRSLRIDLAPERLDVAAEVPRLFVPAHPVLPQALEGALLQGVRLGLTFPLADPSLGVLRIDAEQLDAPGAWGLTAGPLSARLSTSALGDVSADLAVSRVLVQAGATVPLPKLSLSPLLASLRYTRVDDRIDADFATRLSDAPWSGSVGGTLTQRAGEVSARGVLTPALLEIVRPLLPEKARPILLLTDPVQLVLDASVLAGGELSRAVVRATAGRAVARDVRFDRASATLVYEPGAGVFRADELVLVQGDSRADGSYEMDTRSLAFRFLLAGCLRPAGIDGWFGPWWPGFWRTFAFDAAPPDADVDIRGIWRAPRRTTVFIGASGADLRLRDLPLDTLVTRIQVNPGGSLDLLGFRAVRESHSASGAFARILDLETREWSRLAFDIEADFPLTDLPRLFPAEGPAIIAPLQLTAAPRIHLVGETHGPGSATPGRQRYTLKIATAAPLRYQGFPLDALSTRLERTDDEIRLEDLRVGFADGLAAGRAVLSGPAEARWLAYDIALADARLDLALSRWREFRATRPDYLPPNPGEPIVPAKTLGGRVALNLAATGPLADPLAHAGSGSALINEADLAQIRLLGLFSNLLSELGIGLGTLTLTEADARFELQGDRLRFDALRLTGPSALVEADGTYHLPTGILDFTARVRPLEQRSGVISSTLGWMLSPLSSALIVRLEGTLEQPDWTFSYGPTRLLRRITGTRSATPAEPEFAPMPETTPAPALPASE